MGKLVVGLLRLLPLCALLLLLPTLAAAQCVSQLTIQRVWTQDAGGTDKTAFAPGEPIRFAAQLNNSYGAYMLAANGAQVAITTSFYSDTKPVDIPPGVSTWTWNATTPSVQDNYTVTVRAYDHFCGVWVERSATFTVGQAPPPPPRLTLNLNPNSLRPGDTYILTATLTPGSSASPVDVYLVLQFPDKTLQFYQSNGSFTPEARPVVANWTVAPFSGEVFRHTFSGADPAGTYTWYAAFTNPGTLNVIGDIAQAPFTFNPVQNCFDAYFIGVHGTDEGPDSQNQNQTLSQVISETWENFYKLATNLGKNVTGYALDYAGSHWNLFANAVDPGVDRLNTFIRGQVLNSCPTQSIVLVGYSLGAWIVDDWLSRNKDVWPNIVAVELYGDPIWHRTVHAGGAVVTYDGVARNVLAYHGATSDRADPYTDNLQGPGVGISDRWQSRCLKGDPVCGEGYNFSPLTGANQLGLVGNCASNSSCMHRRYTKDGVSNNGYNLTERGAKFLAFKAFPLVTGQPQVMNQETFREGQLVFFRLFFTNPNNEATGFGFVGTGWALENHTFDSPSYGRVHLGQPSVEYPFNHACGTPSAYESDVDAWINYTSQGVKYESNPVLMHMTCKAPCEVVTPYSNFTWDDVPISPDSCQ